MALDTLKKREGFRMALDISFYRKKYHYQKDNLKKEPHH